MPNRAGNFDGLPTSLEAAIAPYLAQIRTAIRKVDTQSFFQTFGEMHDVHWYEPPPVLRRIRSNPRRMREAVATLFRAEDSQRLLDQLFTIIGEGRNVNPYELELLAELDAPRTTALLEDLLDAPSDTERLHFAWELLGKIAPEQAVERFVALVPTGDSDRAIQALSMGLCDDPRVQFAIRAAVRRTDHVAGQALYVLQDFDPVQALAEARRLLTIVPGWEGVYVPAAYVIEHLGTAEDIPLLQTAQSNFREREFYEQVNMTIAKLKSKGMR